MNTFLLLFLVFNFSFSQIKSSDTEDKIYNSIDVFVANPTYENLKKLEKEEAQYKPKYKAEFLALVILNCNKAYYQNQFGFTKNAISSYEKAWKMFQENKLSNYDITENCLKKLGKLYTIIGDLDNAENTIKQYYYIANTEDNLNNKCAAVLNLSTVYQISGRKKNAIQLLEISLKEMNLSNRQKGNLYNNLGSNYLLLAIETDNKKDLKIATISFEKAIKFLKNDNQEAEHLANAYNNLSKIYALNLDYKNATLFLDKSNDLLLKTNQEPRKKAKFYYDKAELLLQQQDYAQAEVFIKNVFSILIYNFKNAKNELPSLHSLYAETVLLDALDLKAQIYLHKNDSIKALKTYELSFYIEALFQQLYTYENSKIINQLRNRNRTEKCIEIYYNLYLKNRKNSYLAEAFQLCEDSKSIVLKNTLRNSKSISKAEKLLQEQLQYWNTIIIKEQKKLELADISKINKAIKKQNEVMLLLKSKTINKKIIVKEKLDFALLFLKLKKDNAVLLDYFVGTNSNFLFTVSNDEITLKKINLEAKKVFNFINYFTDAAKISNAILQYNADANKIYKMVKLPPKSSYKKLIIIADGILNFIPFEALITSKTTTVNFSKMHYLINDYAVGYSNSASFYLNSFSFQHKQESVLGVFPIFENSDLELTYSKKELMAIQHNFKGKYLVNTEATFSNFKLHAGNYSVLHLSTHATAGDLETPASIKFYDQEILYSELYNLKLNPNLVVLSACETGVGKFYKAEGSMSISRGFQIAGVQNLLFSLWKVNDYTTSVFMKKFYENIKNGFSYFDSNYNAKLSYLYDNAIPNAKKSPYYWSSFVYYGTLENNSTAHYFIYIFIIILMVIGLFLLFKKIKYGRVSKDFKEKQV